MSTDDAASPSVRTQNTDPNDSIPAGSPGQVRQAPASETAAHLTVPAREIYRDFVTGKLASDPLTVLLDGDTGLFATDSMPESARSRYFNVGIAEQNMMGMAAGLARDGFRPWVTTFSTFASTRALEAYKLDIAYPNLPVRIVATHSGLSAGHLGPTHHALEDVGILRMLPNTTLVVPADASQTLACLTQAEELDGPVYLRLGRKATPDLTGGSATCLGAVQNLRAGSDITFFACGPHALGAAIGAAERLAAEQISAGVINVHTVKPLDVVGIETALRETRIAVSVEEHWRVGGLGSAIAEVAADAGGCEVVRIGVPDNFVSKAGSEQYLLSTLGIDAVSIASTAWRRLDATRGRSDSISERA